MLSRARLPPSGFIEPCLPSPAERPPSGPGWLHEIKLDGFRLMAQRDAAGVRLLTRNGLDRSRRYVFWRKKLPCRPRRLIRAFEHDLRLRQPNRDASDEIDKAEHGHQQQGRRPPPWGYEHELARHGGEQDERQHMIHDRRAAG